MTVNFPTGLACAELVKKSHNILLYRRKRVYKYDLFSDTFGIGEGKAATVKSMYAYAGEGIAPLILNLSARRRRVVSFTLWSV